MRNREPCCLVTSVQSFAGYQRRIRSNRSGDDLFVVIQCHLSALAMYEGKLPRIREKNVLARISGRYNCFHDQSGRNYTSRGYVRDSNMAARSICHRRNTAIRAISTTYRMTYGAITNWRSSSTPPSVLGKLSCHNSHSATYWVSIFTNNTSSGIRGSPIFDAD